MVFEYKKGRIYPGINEVESYEHDNLSEFFGSDDLSENGERGSDLEESDQGGNG